MIKEPVADHLELEKKDSTHVKIDDGDAIRVSF